MQLFECNICESVFKTKGTHMVLVHEQKTRLNGHMASVHDGKKPFKCEICNVAFTQKHMASVHEGNKSFNCNNCDACFAQNNSLNEHILMQPF